MKKEKLYDQIKTLLEEQAALRECDSKLVAAVMAQYGIYLLVDLHRAPISIESVTRLRRQIQEKCPHLRAQKEVQKWRKEQEAEWHARYNKSGQYELF